MFLRLIYLKNSTFPSVKTTVVCSCIWLAPPRLAFFLAICGVGHPLTIIIIWFNKVVVVVVVVVVLLTH